MAEDASNTTEVEKTSEVEESKGTETQEVQPDESTSTENSKESTEKTLTLDEALAELSKVRKEAADRRTKSKELADALAKAKSPEEFEQAVKSYEDKIAELEREVALSKYTIPEEFLVLLEGASVEKIHQIGPSLSKYAPKGEAPAKKKTEKTLDDLSGGLNPGKGNSVMDLSPQELANRIPRRR